MADKITQINITRYWVVLEDDGKAKLVFEAEVRSDYLISGRRFEYVLGCRPDRFVSGKIDSNGVTIDDAQDAQFDPLKVAKLKDFEAVRVLFTSVMRMDKLESSGSTFPTSGTGHLINCT